MEPILTVVMVVYKEKEGFYAAMGDEGAPMPLIQVRGETLDSTIREAIKKWLEAEKLTSRR